MKLLNQSSNSPYPDFLLHEIIKSLSHHFLVFSYLRLNTIFLSQWITVPWEGSPIIFRYKRAESCLFPSSLLYNEGFHLTSLPCFSYNLSIIPLPLWCFWKINSTTLTPRHSLSVYLFCFLIITFHKPNTISWFLITLMGLIHSNWDI